MKQFLIFSCLLACTIETQTMHLKEKSTKPKSENFNTEILKMIVDAAAKSKNNVAEEKKTTQEYCPQLYYAYPGCNEVSLKGSLEKHSNSTSLEQANNFFCP